MTTKIKIIVGFLVLLVLLCATAFFGYTSLQNASGGFVNFRRLATINTETSDLEGSVHEIAYHIQYYMDVRTPELAEATRVRISEALNHLEIIVGLSKMEATQGAMNKSREQLKTIKDKIDTIERNMGVMLEVYHETTTPKLAQIAADLARLAEGGRNSGFTAPLYYQTLLWKDMANLRENLGQFLMSLSPESAEAMRTNMRDCAKSLDALGSSMTTPAGRADHAAFARTFEVLTGAIELMIASGEKVQADVASAKTLCREVFNSSASVNTISNSQAQENGTAILDSTSQAQRQVLIISVAGILIGLGMALIILVGLVRTLNRMSRYATDIAAGNFDSQVEVKEKGEIGTMFEALRKIPEIFSGVIARCNDISGVIAAGLFRDRLDLEQFSGGFRDLAKGINTIADSYTRGIDNLPVGIVTLDTNYATKFTNTVGARMVGTDTLKAFGGSLPLMESCFREKVQTSAEARLTSPAEEVIDVAATAMPLQDAQGKILGGMEVLTDISEIKSKQILMLEVATEASAIADRIAAASEELAAQVEQISRSAESQRERVEVTASAMTEMNSTVTEVATSASNASLQGSQAREQAQTGSALVNKVVDAIKKVSDISMRLQGDMQSLGQQAESIGSVMHVISDIADQTNLLALNAAIEAARAGDAGRGFAVVADEVRKLAENTMNATKEVGDSIEAVQAAARNNINEVDVAAKSAAEATVLANESGEALDGILMLASSTSDVVASIATAAEEQSAASEEITQAISEINRLVSDTTEGMVQSSEAVQDLSRTAQQLKAVMDRLR